MIAMSKATKFYLEKKINKKYLRSQNVDLLNEFNWWTGKTNKLDILSYFIKWNEIKIKWMNGSKWLNLSIS